MSRPQLAITIDDLPTMQMEDLPCVPVANDLDAARLILSAIRRHAVPVTMFVNSGRFRSEDLGWLREWREAGVELGNHTANHLCVNSVSEAEWQADVRACHLALTSTASTPRFFRFPYLRAGSTPERKRSAEAFLARLGYTIGPVTAVTLEWLLAHYYELARAAAPSLLDEIAATVVPHVLDSMDHAEQVARARFHRTIPQIVLLHVNRLTASRIDELIDTLGRRFELITLAQALRDPVFTTTSAVNQRPLFAGDPGAARRDWFARQRGAILQRFQSRLGWPARTSTLG